MPSADTRFLLYIDILGFKEMTLKEPRKVARLYTILDGLNSHDHPNFKTIVFSDTILVYNPMEVDNDRDREYLVWYLTEFAEDLHSRLVGQDIWFRAVLVAGDFNHYHLKHAECFFGAALIAAYESEKSLPFIGLVMHNNCLKYNQYFRTEQFSSEYNFVYLNRSIESIHDLAPEEYPLKLWEISDMAPDMPGEVKFLSDLRALMRSHPEPSVRAKALSTWDFYERRYPKMVAKLADNSFDLAAIGPKNAWKTESEVLVQNIKYFKRIGSGTPLSLRLGKTQQGARTLQGQSASFRVR